MQSEGESKKAIDVSWQVGNSLRTPFFPKAHQQCVTHGPLLRIIGFARPIAANARERYYCSGSRHQVHKGNTYEKDLGRNAIVRWLKDEAEIPSQERRSLGYFALTE